MADDNMVYVQLESREAMVDKDIASQLQNDESFRENFIRCHRGSGARDNDVEAEEHLKDHLDDNKAEVRWQTPAAQLLVSLRIENDKKFNMQKTHVSLWDEIARGLREKDHSFTGKQCSNKWKSLKREYKAVVDHNSKTGSDKKTCKFFDDFNQLYGNKPSTRPSFTLDTSSDRSVSPAVECSGSSGSDRSVSPFLQCPGSSGVHTLKENEDMTDSEEPPSKKAKTPGRRIKKKDSGVDRMVNFLTSYQDKQRDLQKEHEEFVKDQNAEKLKRFDKLLDIMAKK